MMKGGRERGEKGREERGEEGREDGVERMAEYDQKEVESV